MSHQSTSAAWGEIKAHIDAGLVSIGSRAPIRNVPLWATPEVTYGGFATGKLRAGGELALYERVLAAEARSSVSGSQLQGEEGSENAAMRSAANRYLVEHDAGVTRLLEMLHSRKYRVNVPEEGCLLAYAWLSENNFASDARKLLEKVAPYFEMLRFHPEPRDEREDMSRVSILSVHEVKTQIQEKASRMDTESSWSEQQETVMMWHQMREQVLELWLETLDEPSQQPPNGTWCYDDDSLTTQRFVYAEGCSWPCQQYPVGWSNKATDLVARYNRELSSLKLRAKRHDKYSFMVDAARRAAQRGPQALTGRDVAWIRFGIASVNTKRGLPGSLQYRKWLSAIHEARENRVEATRVRQKLYAYANECLDRIARTDQTRDEMKVYLTASEVQIVHYELTTAFPKHKWHVTSICATLDRAVGMDLDEVFQCECLKSLEMVAQLLPKFTASIRTNALQDQNLAYLYQQILVAFASRRSLLLLNFASQVRVSELPWVDAIDRLVHSQDDTELISRVQNSTREICRKVAINALRRFGEAPLCNTFIGELRPLLQATGIAGCPLIEELAADIFMGSFTIKYVKSYEAAQKYLEGTIYQEYYEIDNVPTNRTIDTLEFAKLCHERTRAPVNENNWSVSKNARVIEQSLILTTHNLATLFITFELHEYLEDLDVPAILQRCWSKIKKLVAQLARTQRGDWRARGPLRRFIGYMWRQMLFFLAVLEKYASREMFLEVVTLIATETEDVAEEEYRAHFATLAAMLRGRGDDDNSSPGDRMNDGESDREEAAAQLRYVVAWS